MPFLDGDLGATGKARECYMKQKHRLLWERRHGKVGTGMKDSKSEVAAEEQIIIKLYVNT